MIYEITLMKEVKIRLADDPSVTGTGSSFTNRSSYGKHAWITVKKLRTGWVYNEIQ